MVLFILTFTIHAYIIEILFEIWELRIKGLTKWIGYSKSSISLFSVFRLCLGRGTFWLLATSIREVRVRDLVLLFLGWCSWCSTFLCFSRFCWPHRWLKYLWFFGWLWIFLFFWLERKHRRHRLCYKGYRHGRRSQCCCRGWILRYHKGLLSVTSQGARS